MSRKEEKKVENERRRKDGGRKMEKKGGGRKRGTVCLGHQSGDQLLAARVVASQPARGQN